MLVLKADILGVITNRCCLTDLKKGKVNIQRDKFLVTSELWWLQKQCLTVKGKAVPLHAMEAHGGRGGIAPTHT
jgi:hypothetical protein